MKKLWKVLLALTVCAAALCVTCAAAKAEGIAPTKVSGKVSAWEGEGIFLKNDNEDDPFHEVVLNIGDIPVVDAATEMPLDMEAVKEGDTLTAWIGPAATMSLPPQVFPKVVVGNAAADAAAPEFVIISGTAVQGEDGKTSFSLLDGGTLNVDAKTVYTPWRTRQIVQVDDLIPGAEALVWKNTDGTAEKVLLFAYGYQGYACARTVPHGDTPLYTISAFINEGASQEAACKKTEDGTLLAPLRAVAEAAGYDVRWDKTLGAVISLTGVDIISVKPGADVVQTSEGESGLSAPCVLEKGVTYVPAEDLCYWLNLFFYAE